MANKTIPSLPIYGSQDSDKRKKDLIEITKNDGTYATPTYGTGASRKMSVEELKTALDITSQTVTDGITDKSPSENAVFDVVYAKGLINGTIWVNAYTALGDFNLSIDKYNNVGYTDAEGPISVILPTFNSTMSGKTIIVEPHRFNDGITTVNISIPGLQKDGGGEAGTYTEVITKMGQIVTIQANYYGWHVIGHTNQVPDISFKLDLDGGNANQDINIDGFGVNAKHFKVNGTGGAGHIGLKHQSANISASASESSIGADIVGDPVWKNDGGAIDKLELQSNKTGTVTGNEASTSKYLTVKGVYDWAVGLFAPKASPTFTGTVTTPDIVVSNATASTPAFFDAVDKLISTTAQLWGTWVQTWASKATPIDADTIGFYNSATTFVGVKSTLLNFWTAYLLPKVQALGYIVGSGLSNPYLPYFNGTNLVNSTVRKLTSTDPQVRIDDRLSIYGQNGNPTLYISPHTTGSGLQYESSNTNKAVQLLMYSTTDNTPIELKKSTSGGYLMWLQSTTQSGQSPNKSFYDDNILLIRTNSSATTPNAGYGNGLYNIILSSTGGLNREGILRFQYYDIAGNKAGYLFAFSEGSWSAGTSTNITPLGVIVGSNSAPHASAILQAESTTKGFLPPRMTNAQRTAIASPAIGLMVYCTDTVEGLWINKSTGWTFIA